jgi:hypothetical protein
MYSCYIGHKILTYKISENVCKIVAEFLNIFLKFRILEIFLIPFVIMQNFSNFKYIVILMKTSD